ncbi:MAG: DUF1294 domain-containing protein [Candidatus Methanomethylophilaceae archaeon]|nr:DUF1294 domain-containing protein [Candidatus Methanomethylophilaceae archaeon]
MNVTLIALGVYVLLNLLSFGMFVWDKHKAKNDQWRTPESTLILSALLGPFGATAGMKLARHKTQKLKFKLVYIFLVIHVIIIVYLGYGALF